ncbi:ABC transporter substrate-binding protein [Pseudonocardia sp. HH130629-09]|uniref:ABC transporter substrate-binding protein n=1 Tax=Pseudonocardia sp. HH130629-09 TaxID=1641402 RepID=UPI0006CB37ED|nr:ABC transporter substrate-binding protein [Pseudonocardia sp. HH130629-09]ALE83868.1 iron-siderophore ABC transporter substrate-binding protein [Pseudonocardia sp. HH130629-09]
MALSMVRRGRRNAVPALALALLLTLTACAGSGGGDSGVGPAGGPALPAAEGTTQYPLTLTTWAGETVLEERPERIAVIGFSPNLDALEALGVTPVYTMAEESEWPWRSQEWLSGIEMRDTVTRRDPINFEGIASTDPDLIVATNFVQDDVTFERLSSIAPVLENPEKVAGDQISWQETQRMVGRALDLPAASETAIAEAEQAIDAVAREHPQYAGRTITIATDYTQSGIDYYTVTGGTAERIVTRMGFAPNPLGRQFVSDPSVADEQVGQLDGDVLVMFYNDAAGRTAREAAPLFRTVPPVAEGRYVGITIDEPGSELTWVLRRGASVTSLPWAVGELARRVDGLDLG